MIRVTQNTGIHSQGQLGRTVINAYPFVSQLYAANSNISIIYSFKRHLPLDRSYGLTLNPSVSTIKKNIEQPWRVVSNEYSIIDI